MDLSRRFFFSVYLSIDAAREERRLLSYYALPTQSHPSFRKGDSGIRLIGFNRVFHDSVRIGAQKWTPISGAQFLSIRPNQTKIRSISPRVSRSVLRTLNNATNLRNKSWWDESRKKFGNPCGVMVWVGSYLGIWKD